MSQSAPDGHEAGHSHGAKMRKLRKTAILEVYQLALAIFLFVSPWLFAFAHGSVRIDDWASAGIVAVISFVALVAFRDWEEWIIFLLGVWISASPWVLGFQHTPGMFANLLAGTLIAYLAILELWLIHYGSYSESALQ